ncbi:MAG: hypothetical protein AAF639_47105, partial [Chloroflexota bacterium]
KRYVEMAHNEHLHNQTNYERRTKEEAISDYKKVIKQIQRLQQFHHNSFTDQEAFYIEHYATIDNIERTIPQFYLTIKVHKQQLASRPIVSYSGSPLYGLAKWLDYQLQPLVKKLKSFIQDSRQLLNDCTNIDMQNAELFTADAIGMYSNISTTHALSVIKDFLKTNPLCEDTDWKPIYIALCIVMRHNIFQFSDLYFRQVSGTAMGTPPAPSYATLYMGIKEMELHKFNTNILLYK